MADRDGVVARMHRPAKFALSLVMPEARPVSAASNRALSLLHASSSESRRTARETFESEVPDIQHVLGPEERLLAVLPGTDARGAVTWIASTRRLIVLTAAHPDQDIAQVSHAAVTCVELRTDPLGTTLRVRATGRQLTMQTLDAALATQFGSLLRERAGIGLPHAPSRPALEPTPMHHHLAARQMR